MNLGILLSNRLSRWLLAAVMVLGALAWVAAWSVSSPTASSPDEDFHLPSIWCPVGMGRCPTQINPITGEIETYVPVAVVAGAVCWRFDAAQSAACAMDLPQWYDPATQTIPMRVWNTRVNQGEYPGGFYETMNLFVTNPGNVILDVYRSVVAMRIANGFSAVLLLSAVAYLLPWSGKRLLAYSFIIVASPMVIFLIASANPSSWSITGLLVTWFGSYAAFRGRTFTRQLIAALLAVVGGLLAATSRTDSAAFLAAMSIGIAVMHWHYLRFRPSVAAAPLLPSGPTTELATPGESLLPSVSPNWSELGPNQTRLWLWALPLILLGIGVIGFATAGHSAVLGEGFGFVDRWPNAVLFNNLLQLPGFIMRVPTPMLNWLDTPMPQISIVPVSVGWVLLVLWGWSKSKWSWPKAITFAGVLVLLIGLPLYLLQISGQFVGFDLQERYLLPLIPIVLAISLWRPHQDGAPRLSRSYTWLLYILVVVGHAAALHTQIRRFSRGIPGDWRTWFYTNPRLNTDVQWWLAPLPPMATWLIGSLGFALVALAVLAVRWKHAEVSLEPRDA